MNILLLLHIESAWGRFEGFNSQMANDARSELALDENESSSGMTREMSLMQELTWEIQPIDFQNIKDGQLRRYLKSYLKDPVKLKLSRRKGKFGLRAIGQAGSDKKLRAYWRQAGGSSMKTMSSEYLKASYDDAIKSRLSMLEFEVQLPPRGKNSGIVSLVYTCGFEPGTMNSKSIVPRGAASVQVLPEGRAAEGRVVQIIQAGKAHIGIPARGGLVDPGWARGRSIFRFGRTTGTV
jgi:hypothetical protein